MKNFASSFPLAPPSGSPSLMRRYAALYASIVEGASAREVAERFHYSEAYVHLLRHHFKQGKIDITRPRARAAHPRPARPPEIRERVLELRDQHLSAEEIARGLEGEGRPASPSTVERVLTDEGLPRLPRRTKILASWAAASAPDVVKAAHAPLSAWDGRSFTSPYGGVLLLAPFTGQLGVGAAARGVGIVDLEGVAARHYLLALHSLKLLGPNRFARPSALLKDPALALVSGLKSMPSFAALSAFSAAAETHAASHLQGFIEHRAPTLELATDDAIGLDFCPVPAAAALDHRDNGAAGNRPAGSRVAFVVFAVPSGRILHAAAPVRRLDALALVEGQSTAQRLAIAGTGNTLIFDSRVVSYAGLSRLNQQGVDFITERRRVAQLAPQLDGLEGWKTAASTGAQFHDSMVTLPGYAGRIRQVVVRPSGTASPSFILTNDLSLAPEGVAKAYSRLAKAKQRAARAFKFFGMNSPTSPVSVGVSLDVALTTAADLAYRALARLALGRQDQPLRAIFDSLVNGEAQVTISGRHVRVTLPQQPGKRDIVARLRRAEAHPLPAYPNTEVTYE